MICSRPNGYGVRGIKEQRDYHHKGSIDTSFTSDIITL